MSAPTRHLEAEFEATPIQCDSRRHSRELKQADAHNLNPVGVLGRVGEEVSHSDLPRTYVEQLAELTGGPVPGRDKLLCGHYGITSYDFTEPRRIAGSQRHVAVLAHGIGASKDITWGSPIRDSLLGAGYTVLSYSFLGHGWSYAGNEVAPSATSCGSGCSAPRYDREIFLTQVKEVLDHVLELQEPIDLWIGHSTGGIMGPLVAAEGIRAIRRFALVSPACWAEKSPIATLADSLHPFSTMLVSRLLLPMVEQEYVKLNAAVFAMKDDGTYFHPIEQGEALAGVQRQFRLHPQISQAVLAVNSCFVRGDLLPKHRAVWQALLEQGDAPPTLLLWGDHDVVTPFEHAAEVVAWNPDRVTLRPLEDLGHESVAEDPGRIAKEIVSFFGVPGATGAPRHCTQ